MNQQVYKKTGELDHGPHPLDNNHQQPVGQNVPEGILVSVHYCRSSLIQCVLHTHTLQQLVYPTTALMSVLSSKKLCDSSPLAFLC